MTSSTDTRGCHRPSATRTPALVSRCWKPGRRMRGVDHRDAHVRGQRGRPAGQRRRHRRHVHRVVPRLPGTWSNIWLPFPLDLIREEHVRRLSLVLQRHGLELLIGAPCGRARATVESARSIVHCAGEVRAVDDLDHAVLAALGGLTLTDEIESMLRADDASSVVDTREGRCWMFCSSWRFSTDLTRGYLRVARAWKIRQPGLQLFAGWLVRQCEMTQGQAASFLNVGSPHEERAQKRSTLSTLIKDRHTSQQDLFQRSA